MCQLSMREISLHAADYVADGYTVDEYLHDQTVVCEVCAGVFDDMINDGRYSEATDRWVCLPCLYENHMGR